MVAVSLQQGGFIVPRKTGVILCAQCKLPVREEGLRVLGRSKGAKSYDFCSKQCFKEFYFEDEIQSEINRKVNSELNFLHKRICPSCRSRII